MTDFEQKSTSTQEITQGLIDPVAALLSDPQSHYSDILYMNFRIYKSKVLWNFLQSALKVLQPQKDDIVHLADIGASMGFDALSFSNKLTNNFSTELPFKQLICSLVEGNAQQIELGKVLVKTAIKSGEIRFDYYHHPMVLGLPLKDQSQQIVLCSEVVEHLEDPAKLLSEIHRILVPGGFFLLTTDNCPSALQYIKRIPVALRGNYDTAYARPPKETEVSGVTEWQGQQYPIYGHINLNSTWRWEELCEEAGFKIFEYGTYESIRRGGGRRNPLSYCMHFLAGAVVYYLMPKWLGRYFGDTTALLLQKPI